MYIEFENDTFEITAASCGYQWINEPNITYLHLIVVIWLYNITADHRITPLAII